MHFEDSMSLRSTLPGWWLIQKVKIESLVDNKTVEELKFLTILEPIKNDD